MQKVGAHTTSYDYDGLDRLTKVTDAKNGITQYEYDPNGNLTKETDVSSGRVTTYTYDADNKVKSVQEPDGRTDYTYDKNGNVTQQKHTVGSTVITHDFAYNSLNQLTNIKENGTDRAWFTYNETDQVASRKNGDGTTTLYKYKEPVTW